MKHTLSFLLKLLVTLTVLGFIVYRLGWENLSTQVRQAQPGWLLAALAVFILSGVLGAVQWRLLLRNRGIELSFARALKLYFIGMFFNNFIFGTVAADAVKITYLKMNRGSIKAGFAATALDRFAGLWAMSGFAVVAGIVLLRNGEINTPRIALGTLFLAVTFCGFGGIVLFLLSTRLQKLFFTVLGALPLPKKESIRALVSEMLIEARDRYLLLPVALLSTMIQFLRVSVHVICGFALGITTLANMHYFFVFVPFLALLMIMPLPFGIREGIEGSLFALAGFSADAAIVMGFLASFVGIAAGLSGGGFFLFERVRIPKGLPDEAVDSGTPAQRAGKPAGADG